MTDGEIQARNQYLGRLIDEALANNQHLLTPQRLVLPVLIHFPGDYQFHTAPLDDLQLEVFRNNTEVEHRKKQLIGLGRAYVQLEIKGKAKQ